MVRKLNIFVGKVRGISVILVMTFSCPQNVIFISMLPSYSLLDINFSHILGTTTCRVLYLGAGTGPASAMKREKIRGFYPIVEMHYLFHNG